MADPVKEDYQIQVYGQEGAPPDSSVSEDNLTLGGLFTTKKPRGLGSGIGSGASNVVKGVAFGVAGLVTAPVMGYQSTGLKGAAEGLGIGVAGAVALPVVGVGLGVYQVIEGANIGVQSLSHSGEKFDSDQNKWVPKYKTLDQDLTDSTAAHGTLLRERAARAKLPPKKPKRDGKKVADLTYYDMLGVPPDASDAEIKKSYYQLARETHPDKMGNTPEATARFQEVGEAYQILCDPKRREQYDLHGKSATDMIQTVDAGVFFTLLFGSDAFEPFIGKLPITALLELSENNMDDLNLAIDPREQAFREATLACNLREFLKEGVAAKMEGNDSQIRTWRRAMEAKANDLAQQSFGCQLLEALGYTYKSYAKYHQKKTWTASIKYNYSKSRWKASNMWKVVQSASGAYSSNKKAEKSRQRAARQQKKRREKAGDVEQGTTDIPSSPEETTAQEDSVQHLLETLVRICCGDVVDTGGEVSRKYLNDPAIPKEERTARQYCLLQVGVIFQQTSKTKLKLLQSSNTNFMDHFEQARARAYQEQDNQEHDSSRE